MGQECLGAGRSCHGVRLMHLQRALVQMPFAGGETESHKGHGLTQGHFGACIGLEPRPESWEQLKVTSSLSKPGQGQQQSTVFLATHHFTVCKTLWFLQPPALGSSYEGCRSAGRSGPGAGPSHSTH